MADYDFILAGGGVSGLTLAYHLLRSPLAGRRILIVDRGRERRDHHALSFWTAGPTPYEEIVARTWDSLQVVGPNFQKRERLQQLRYQSINSSDFYHFVLEALTSAPNVTLRQGNVTAIEDTGSGPTVRVDGQAYRARWVFDSLFTHTDFPPGNQICLWQCFHGWKIETPAATFNPQVATLMDFHTEQPGGWRFFYVLPFSERHALIESVSLSPSHGEQALSAYITERLGIRDYQIVAREAGVTPLTTYPFPRQLGPHVMAIGIKGGRIKPSSGYGFLRMQQDAAAIVRSLLANGHPFGVPGDRRFYRFCDLLMLRTLHRHREWALPLFTELLQRNPIERVLCFLDGTTSPGENLRLMASLLPRILSLTAAAWSGHGARTQQPTGIGSSPKRSL